jgi:hypothetical protein
MDKCVMTHRNSILYHLLILDEEKDGNAFYDEFD